MADIKKILAILDIIVIILVLFAFVYFFIHRTEFIDVLNGACKVCEQKTGSVCIRPIGMK